MARKRSEDEEFLDDFLAVGEQETQREKRKANTERVRIIARNVMIVIVAIALAFGVFYLYKEYNVQQERQAAEQAEAARPRVSIQLVNGEQVEYADRLCKAVTRWNQEDFPVYQNPEKPNVVRKDMAQSLYANADRMEKQAMDIVNLPKLAHIDAIRNTDAVLLPQTLSVVDAETIDPGIEKANADLLAALGNYTASMRDMAKNLEDLSSYNYDGMRAEIIRINSMFEAMNADLEQNLKGIFTTDLFENEVTMEAVSELESCNEGFIDIDTLAPMEETLTVQEAIRDRAAYNRCIDFLQSNSNKDIQEDIVRENLEACDEFVQQYLGDPEDVIGDKVVEGFEGQIALPKISKSYLVPERAEEVVDLVEGEDEENAEDGEEATDEGIQISEEPAPKETKKKEEKNKA